MKKKKIVKQGQYLKEVGVSFIVRNPINIDIAKKFLEKIVKILRVKKVGEFVNPLPPGFDISINIKESIIYFGYWGESRYIRMYCASCKNFNEERIIKLIKKVFEEREGSIRLTIINDAPIENEVEDLCLIRY